MTTTNQPDEDLPIVKTDVIGRVKIDRAHREQMLDAFEASGMSAAAFSQLHGVKQQTFASWIQKRRRARGDYENEEIRRKLRMGQGPNNPKPSKPKSSDLPTLNFIELDTNSRTSSELEALEVTLPNGISIKVVSEAQVALLKSLVAALQC